jgi:molecular chaperone GrpE
MEENKDLNANTDSQDPDNDILSQADTQQVLDEIDAATLDPRDLELATLKLELDAHKDKYLRLYADFDNYKKRNAKERLDLMLTASKDVIQELLPVLDDFERAMRAAETSTEVAPVVEGVQLIYNTLVRNLETKGLKAFESKGLDFNVEMQEAITEIPAPSPDMIGKVIDEVEKGYHLNDKIIRFAKVVVGK